ncbi:hypothetical protein MRB53_021175 [Persea americana]|uniref:Uncharacterized protein n=1 Tax=Persea americana TaxID=3435 RepID=A0ACC2L4A2_PERAE|nr:hypothetical protein MRB53_021175 [Persea americana]
MSEQTKEQSDGNDLETGEQWRLYVDGASNAKGSGGKHRRSDDAPSSSSPFFFDEKVGNAAISSLFPLFSGGLPRSSSPPQICSPSHSPLSFLDQGHLLPPSQSKFYRFQMKRCFRGFCGYT